MGTTESTFVDDTTEKSSEDEYRNHPHQHHSTTGTSNGDPASFADPPMPQRRRRLSTDPGLILQQQQLQQQQQQQQPYSSSRIPHPQSKKERLHGVKLMTQLATSGETCFLLHGCLVGKARSGKRTLLQRLAGKEPQFTKRRRQRASTTSASEIESLQSDDAIIEPFRTRYQPPPLSSSSHGADEPALLDASIQLEVHVSDKADHMTVPTPHDFYLILVDPRHDRSKLHKYVKKAVHSALHSQGYATTSTTDSASTHQRRPLCLCLLRNFCDLVSNEEEDAETIITGSDLVSWTMLVLEQYDLDESLLVLQCTNTSLVNCYGLSTLHSFIYHAYLQRKRHDIVRQLSRIDEITTATKRSAPIEVSYEQYIQNLGQMTSSAPSLTNHAPMRSTDASLESQTSTTLLGDDSATTATSNGASPRRYILGVASTSPTRPLTPPSPPATDNKGNHTTATTSIQSGVSAVSLSDSSDPPTLVSTPQPPVDHAKKVLEAFLESDSDESESHQDGTTVPMIPTTATNKNNSNSPPPSPPMNSVVTIEIPAADSTTELDEATRDNQQTSHVKPLSLRQYDIDSGSDDEFYINEGDVELNDDG